MSTRLSTLPLTAVLALVAAAWLAPGPFCCSMATAEPAPTLQPPAGTSPRQQAGGRTAPPIQVAPGVAAGPTPKTKFDPKVHGFEFTNYFTGDILVDLPVIGRLDLGDTTYGLCGGMVFSALDTFKLGATTPDVPTTPPASGTPIRSYVYERQMDSLKYDNWFLVQKLIKWMRKPLKDQTVPNPLAKGGKNVLERGLITLSRRQFKEKIRPALDEGRPVPIVLVKADGEDMATNPKAAFSKNHQVLAIGYHKYGDDWQIDIYDPNFPNTTQTLHTDGRYQTERGKTAHTGKFRGFFRAPYNPHRPPWVQDSQAVADRIKRAPLESLGKPESED